MVCKGLNSDLRQVRLYFASCSATVSCIENDVTIYFAKHFNTPLAWQRLSRNTCLLNNGSFNATCYWSSGCSEHKFGFVSTYHYYHMLLQQRNLQCLGMEMVVLTSVLFYRHPLSNLELYTNCTKIQWCGLNPPPLILHIS